MFDLVIKKQNLVLLVDREIGVEYLGVTAGLGNPSGITPLLNADGTPKINTEPSVIDKAAELAFSIRHMD